MSETLRLHRGHVALLDKIQDGKPRAAFERDGAVQIDGVHQDFLVGWYEDLKSWALIVAEDLLGRSGNRLGETVQITDKGRDIYQRVQQTA